MVLVIPEASASVLSPGFDRYNMRLNRHIGVNSPYAVPCEHRRLRNDDADYQFVDLRPIVKSE